MTQTAFRTAVAAWQDSGRAGIALARLVIPTFLLLVASRPGIQALMPDRSPVATEGVLWATILMDLLIPTPLAVAVYRFNLLGERRAGQVFNNWQRLWRLFRGLLLIEIGAILIGGVIIAVLVLLSIAMVMVAHIPITGPVAQFGAASLMCLVIVIVCMCYVLRTVLMLPAIAVDSPVATAHASWARTRGRIWRMTLMGIITELPLIIVALFGVVAAYMLLGGRIVAI